MNTINEFLASLQPWLTIGLVVLLVAVSALMIVFASRYRKEKKYAENLLDTVGDLEEKSETLENQTESIAKALETAQDEAATAKSEKHTLEERVEALTAQLEADNIEIISLKEDISLKDKKLKNTISMEEHKKVVEELSASKQKASNVDTLITKVEELTEKTKPVIKKVIKKESAKIKKYSLEDLHTMYKHELMTLAQSLKLTGWTRYSKEKLVNFIYENLPKEQKKKE